MKRYSQKDRRVRWLAMAVLIAVATVGATWNNELMLERQRKDAEFKASPTSPMAAIKRLLAPPGSQMVLIESQQGLALGPQSVRGAKMLLRDSSKGWIFESPASGVMCQAEGKAIGVGMPIPTGAYFQIGRYTLTAYISRDGLALVVFDPQRPERQSFVHLMYYSPDPAYAVSAKLEKFATSEKVSMLTSRNLEKTFFRYGRIHFRLSGQSLTLTAFKSAPSGPDSHTLFIPFKDPTNGAETYGVGRFLEIPEPVQAEFVLDFNRCFNPLCNYSPAYNCPLPPRENFLSAAIRAGEKTYPH